MGIAAITIADGYVSSVYGDGSDGAADFDGVTAFAGFSNLVGTTYTLTRDIFLSRGSVAVGATLKSGGFRIYCRGIFDNEGIVSCDGNDAALSVAGAASPAGTLGRGAAGGAGSAGVGTGAAGSNQANTIGNGTAGAAGAGGAGGADGGGAGGTYVPAFTNGSATFLGALLSGCQASGNTFTTIQGGSGGGGGGADNAGITSGGGGGGGGVLALHAYNLVNNGSIRARGGKGADATGTGGNGGGGGGGKGGVILQVSRFRGGVGTIDCNGGVGGAKLGAGGAAGAAGAAGTVMQGLAE